MGKKTKHTVIASATKQSISGKRTQKDGLLRRKKAARNDNFDEIASSPEAPRNDVVAPSPVVPWIIAIGFFMNMMDGSILNTALPAIARDIGENPLQIQSVIISYFLTIAFLLPLSGWLADRFGAKRTFGAAIILFTLGSVFCAVSSNLSELVAARVFQAAGGALLVPIGRLIVMKLYPKEQFVSLLSFIMMPALIGPMIGPVLGGFLAEHFTWHWIFLINVPVGAACFWLNSVHMPAEMGEEPYEFDWPGFALFSLGVVLFCLVVNDSAYMGLTALSKAALALAAYLLLHSYVRHAKRIVRPLFSMRLFKIPTFTIGTAGQVFVRLGIGGIPYLLPLLMQVGMGISPTRSGFVMFVGTIGAISAKRFVPRLVHGLGFGRLLGSTTILVGLTMVGFGAMGFGISYGWILVLAMVQAFLNSIQFTAMATLPLLDLPPKLAGEGNALTSVAMYVSMSAGVSIAAGLSNYFAAPGGFGWDALDALRLSLVVMGIFTIFTSLIFARIPKQSLA